MGVRGKFGDVVRVSWIRLVVKAAQLELTQGGSEDELFRSGTQWDYVAPSLRCRSAPQSVDRSAWFGLALSSRRKVRRSQVLQCLCCVRRFVSIYIASPPEFLRRAAF